MLQSSIHQYIIYWIDIYYLLIPAFVIIFRLLMHLLQCCIDKHFENGFWKRLVFKFFVFLNCHLFFLVALFMYVWENYLTLRLKTSLSYQLMFKPFLLYQLVFKLQIILLQFHQIKTNLINQLNLISLRHMKWWQSNFHRMKKQWNGKIPMGI